MKTVLKLFVITLFIGSLFTSCTKTELYDEPDQLELNYSADSDEIDVKDRPEG